ncbi:hypothetical protein PtB15_4B130 [Puccinia triticina]|nr:hypothetical protein PtB15_4B130 [Puccinia triticina]
MVSHQAKQEKLARKLLPNHSIRSDEQEVSSHQRRRPGSSSLPSSDKVEIEWFDCSQNTEKKNEDCLKTLFEIPAHHHSPAVKKTKPDILQPNRLRFNNWSIN